VDLANFPDKKFQKKMWPRNLRKNFKKVFFLGIYNSPKTQFKGLKTVWLHFVPDIFFKKTNTNYQMRGLPVFNLK
jgi:hypothetical protein